MMMAMESTSYDQTNKKGAGVYMFSAEDTSIQDGNNTIAIKVSYYGGQVLMRRLVLQARRVVWLESIVIRN